MELAELIRLVADQAQSAETNMLRDDYVEAYNDLNNLHDLFLEHFVDMPNPT